MSLPCCKMEANRPSLALVLGIVPLELKLGLSSLMNVLSKA